MLVDTTTVRYCFLLPDGTSYIFSYVVVGSVDGYKLSQMNIEAERIYDRAVARRELEADNPGLSKAKSGAIYEEGAYRRF